jgi:hypothetical protein
MPTATVPTYPCDAHSALRKNGKATCPFCLATSVEIKLSTRLRNVGCIDKSREGGRKTAPEIWFTKGESMTKIGIYGLCGLILAFAILGCAFIWKWRGNEPTIFYVMLFIGFVGAAIGGSGFILLIAYNRILQ